MMAAGVVGGSFEKRLGQRVVMAAMVWSSNAFVSSVAIFSLSVGEETHVLSSIRAWASSLWRAC